MEGKEGEGEKKKKPETYFPLNKGQCLNWKWDKGKMNIIYKQDGRVGCVQYNQRKTGLSKWSMSQDPPLVTGYYRPKER